MLIYVNDEDDINGRYKQAVALDRWLKGKLKLLKSKILMEMVDVTDAIMFVGNEIVKKHDVDIANRNCVRFSCPERYGEYDDYDEESS